MPKKNGISKTYSFDSETIKQLEELAKHYKLKPTNLIEFLINKEHKSITDSRHH